MGTLGEIRQLYPSRGSLELEKGIVLFEETIWGEKTDQMIKGAEVYYANDNLAQMLFHSLRMLLRNTQDPSPVTSYLDWLKSPEYSQKLKPPMDKLHNFFGIPEISEKELSKFHQSFAFSGARFLVNYAKLQVTVEQGLPENEMDRKYLYEGLYEEFMSSGILHNEDLDRAIVENYYVDGRLNVSRLKGLVAIAVKFLSKAESRYQSFSHFKGAGQNIEGLREQMAKERRKTELVIIEEILGRKEDDSILSSVYGLSFALTGYLA